MKNLKINQQAILTFFRRFHLVIFVVVVVLSLSVAVILLYGIVGKASGDNPTTDGTKTNSFDQATIDRIEQLRTIDQPSTPLDFSQGRIDPFSE